MASIGVIGGGQLAAMLADVCRPAGVACAVLDPDPQCPAAIAGAKWVEGDSNDLAAVRSLASQVDVVTVEIENVNVQNLKRIEEEGRELIPGADVLSRLVNKYEQKKTLQAASVPTSPFVQLRANKPITQAPFGYPVVWKASRGGYDGRGVVIVEEPGPEPFAPPTDGFIEAHVAAQAEIAVMVAVSKEGELATWAPVEMTFTAHNTLDYLISPARVSQQSEQAARELAERAIRAVGGVGIFGVEMFLDHEGELFVNEIAPRTHNSGHVTMDASDVSQFEQQLRILRGEPLKATTQRSPAVMINILGAPGYKGKTLVENLAQVEAMPDAHVHLYGKRQCFPGRKMGHVTLTASSIPLAMERMAEVRKQLVVRGERKYG